MSTAAETATGLDMAAKREGAGASAPFGSYERMVAWRYLKPRRKEAAVSIVTVISLIGVTLGVAALIIVMAVMNGFRGELLDRILGLNGHIFITPIERPLDDYVEVSARIETAPGVIKAVPLVEGQALVSGAVG
ncbi:MAG: ABC transporter permease, partial [Pseudomonadota bacterium]